MLSEVAESLPQLLIRESALTQFVTSLGEAIDDFSVGDHCWLAGECSAEMIIVPNGDTTCQPLHRFFENGQLPPEEWGREFGPEERVEPVRADEAAGASAGETLCLVEKGEGGRLGNPLPARAAEDRGPYLP